MVSAVGEVDGDAGVYLELRVSGELRAASQVSDRSSSVGSAVIVVVRASFMAMAPYRPERARS
jgi:hypothetical protein